MSRWPFAFLVLVLVLPAAAATDVTFYAHIDDPFSTRFPVSPDAPPADYHVDTGIGLLTHSLGCGPEVPGVDLRREWHQYQGFLAPGPVEYTQGRPAYPSHLGFHYEVALDQAHIPVFHWYVSAGDEAGLPVPMEVEARVRLLEGNGLTDDSEDAKVIATGSSGPVLMVPGAHGHSEVDGRDVYHFQVPLDMEHHQLPWQGVALRVDLRTPLPVCDQEGENLLLDQLRIHSSPDHRPRLELSVLEPVRVAYVDAQFENGSFVLHAGVQSALGPAAWQGSTLSLVGPDGPIATPPPTYRSSHCHCYPPPPETLQWVISDADWAPGLYTYKITFAGPARDASFEGVFAKPADAQAPGAPLALAASALVTAALARRAVAGALRGRTGS